ncbi:ATP phosphoribosyltransferase [Acetivibrio clariflavus]|uniref:ATP phosphoribosyltransferase n=1 Tax=Acetivibrio clariflavus (strain DSM 19732 / NBRC 101661 / EBR45) TaxID=720554 RepID=G8M2K0_ACECE|nr:ATP phosphoribosyltransferase [Acetivibrio clariflavus]AEV70370.1 ATP phosphoribosyltransferase catalytic subunit [Acetivibrio clariflavus DSM 19732]HOQ01084.1 ATP phosphoribosyltransferase [Acetivibrio clariflavus]
MRYLTVALSKGRLTELSVELFEAIGLDCTELKGSSRKLILTDEKNKVKFFLAKPSDVPTYVEYGAADLGIVGKDTLLEEGRHLYEVLNLGFAACRMVVAGPAELQGKLDQLNNIRVATKYPRIAREYFELKRRESIEVIKLNGSVELAPLVGLSEVIVDLVESGRTLKENGLVVLDHIADISARLVVNRVSMKMESERINNIVDGIRKELEKR